MNRSDRTPIAVEMVADRSRWDVLGKEALGALGAILLTIILLLFSACSTNGQEAADNKDNNAAQTLQVEPPSRADVLLVQRMRNASIPEVQEFMREVLDEGLPEDYVIPEAIVNAGSAEEASKVIGQRFPEFYLKQGRTLIEAAKQDPLRFKEMIRESRAVRKLYSPPEEVQTN